MKNRGGGRPTFVYNNIIITVIDTLCERPPSITDSGRRGCRRMTVAAAASDGSVVAAGAAAGRRQVRDAPASTRLTSLAPAQPSLWASGPVAEVDCSAAVAVAETIGCCRTGTPCPSASMIPIGSSAETTKTSMNKRSRRVVLYVKGSASRLGCSVDLV